MRVRPGLPPLRERALFAAIRDALREASRSPTLGRAFRVLHFSVQRDHLHLVVEAHDGLALARGMQGVGVRVARAVNRTLGVTGPVIAHRFHSHELRSPREVRNALVYVLMNFRKHGRGAQRSGDVYVDAFSSAPWFDGFRDAIGPPPADVECPIAAPRTWLASVGWRRRGLIRN
jgi:REP element-mobilizing transposase RayT